MTIDRSPHLPPLARPELPRLGGRIGPSPEHFRVDEVPAYPTSGRGEHLYLHVEKTGLNTPDVERALSRAFKVHPRAIGYAGLKDKNAVTRQWFSVLTKSTAEGLELGPNITVLETSRHDNKLRTGHLRGNKFVITLVGIAAPKEHLAPLEEHVFEHGVYNYFGPQRFGFNGRNLSQAFLAFDARPTAEDDEHSTQERRPPRRHFDLKLLSSALQAEFFNRYVTRRRREEADLVKGEIVRLEGSAKCFVVQELEKELPRLHKGDIHPTGPMIGPKAVQAEARALELELDVERELELNDVVRAELARAAPGTRRDLLLRPKNLTIESFEGTELRLSFELPAGAYATEVVRHFTGASWTER